MKNIYRAGMSALSIVVMTSAFSFGANALDATDPAAKAVVAKPTAAAPAAKVAADPAKPAAAKTVDAVKPAAAKPVVAKKVASVSVCKGLDEKLCGGNKACDWIVPKDPNDKTGKLQEPYCRKIAGVALKKPMVKPAAAASATTTAAPAAKPTVKAAAKPAVTATAPATVAVKPPAPAAAQ